MMTAKKVFARPITRSRLHEEILTIIQKQIMDGTIPAGSKLPTEREMAQTFNVNRATVREALSKLENLDLVEIRHGDGLYAKNYLESGNLDLIKAAFNIGDHKEIMSNILEARRYIIPQVAYIAAQRRTAADLKELKQVISREDLNMLERDIKVHQIIARATHNLVCTIGLNYFNQIFHDYGYLYFDDKHNAERSRVFHREIYEAIKNKKSVDARRIMRDVLIYAEDAVNASLNNKQQKE
ncbi:MAG: FadR/GntR family transcriptional regulator [Smithella sp.]|jgi:GntR family transcriptional repressor for pyruvate dehydrogenase complex